MIKLAAVVVATVLLAACAQEPPFLMLSSVGRTVGLLTMKQGKADHIVLVDNETGEARKIAIPRGWMPERLVGIGEQFLVMGQHALRARNQFQADDRLLDPATGKFSSALLNGTLPYTPFAGTWQGKPAVFCSGRRVNTTDVRTLPDFSVAATLDFYAYGLHGGWMLSPVLPPGELQSTSMGWMRSEGKQANGNETFRMATLDGMDLYDENAKPVMRLSREQLKAAQQRDVVNFTASLSPDHRSLLVAPSASAFAISLGHPRPSAYPLGYAVFEVPSGKVLFLGGGAETVLSPAILKDDGVYAVMNDSDRRHAGGQHTWLTRQTAAGMEKLLELPLQSKYGIPQLLGSVASADGKNLLMVDMLAGEKLYIVPLRPGVTTAEIRVVDLPR